ncbi:MAG: hypothetical protein AAF708_00375 [Deinococcota bacterium]
MTTQPLELKRRRFAELVVKGVDKTDAYGNAFEQYNAKSAAQSACRLIKDAQVLEYINALKTVYAARGVDPTTDNSLGR